MNWDACANVYELGQLLVADGVFETELWRRFHCRCCRRVWEFITDERARSAIGLAESYSAGEVPIEELQACHKEMSSLAERAWQVVESLRETPDPSEWVWPLSEEVRDAWVSYLSASCGKEVTDPSLGAFTIPDGASSLLAWATAQRGTSSEGSESGIPDRSAAERRWKCICDAEEKEQMQLLRSLVDQSLFQ